MPQPIDMQTELGRTLAAERMQDAAARAALLAQQRAQIDAERQRADHEHVVAETKQTESEGVNRDGRGQGHARERQRRRGAEEAPAPSRRPISGEDHALDVTV